MVASVPNAGRVTAVRGSVIDASFPSRIPAVFNLLEVGAARKVVIEVVAHLTSDTVRGMALTSTQGLARGDGVIDTERSLSVPVREQVLGRLFNVFGETIDRKGPLPKLAQAAATHVKPEPRRCQPRTA
jgi:F-type H+-transporting ATPase subunit beta